MKLRCGRCRMTFTADTALTEMACPACGTKNRVPATGPAPAAPQPPAPGRTTCPDCGYSFAVGTVDVAICPNCRTEVEVESGPVPGGSAP